MESSESTETEQHDNYCERLRAEGKLKLEKMETSQSRQAKVLSLNDLRY